MIGKRVSAVALLALLRAEVVSQEKTIAMLEKRLSKQVGETRKKVGELVGLQKENRRLWSWVKEQRGPWGGER